MDNCMYIKENDRYRLRVMYDEYPEDPRRWDHLGIMVCWHREYCLGDKHDFKTPRDFYFSLAEELVGDTNKVSEMSPEDVEAFVLGNKDIVILPLFLMDHGGLSLRTTSDAFRACDPVGWDWGQIGWIYVTLDRARKELTGWTTDEQLRKRAKEMLEAEVREYDTYLRGDVYCYVLEKKQACDKCGHVEYTIVDSCAGFTAMTSGPSSRACWGVMRASRSCWRNFRKSEYILLREERERRFLPMPEGGGLHGVIVDENLLRRRDEHQEIYYGGILECSVQG